jgi:sugar lactone lactonase YvrE
MTDFSNVSLSEISIKDGTERFGLYFSTLAGLATSVGSSDGTGSAARFYFPSGIAVTTAGNLFVVDQQNQTIRKVTSAGVVTTVAGTVGVTGTLNGTGTNARFYYPFGIAVTTAGNLFVADTYNHTIRKITSTGIVTTFAGSAGNIGTTDGTGSGARFNFPFGIAVSTAGNLFVADTQNNTIRKVTSAGVVTTLAGSAGVTGSADGTGSAARFFGPVGVHADTAGNVFVADTNNQTIRKVTSAGVVTTLAGTVGVTGGADGTGLAAIFYNPTGIAVTTAGNLFVVDQDNDAIRRVTSAGIVTTVAGALYANGSTDGIGSDARFNDPFGIAIDKSGNVFVTDRFNLTIRNSNGIITAY